MFPNVLKPEDILNVTIKTIGPVAQQIGWISCLNQLWIMLKKSRILMPKGEFRMKMKVKAISFKLKCLCYFIQI